ncbi:bacterial extracellular solute-binding protein, family 3 [Plectosphaerella cucumerina]|jgi:cyclohexadienyl dehydratase|uniref:Bacterial extracellular solute-binding protein, family 3 n=1 Tax=Plectosphaerella cucumerina TaxID=40658 RepID=A0A8K0TBA9_9PEZI|nr:bacterial extracellular solute-binding protein, family 3 [Plectosphaerella cucumerina]
MVNFRPFAAAALIGGLPNLTSAQRSCGSPAAPLAYGNLTSVLDDVLARGYLTVGTTGDYKPFTYLITNPNTTDLLRPDGSPLNTTYIGADIDAAQSLSNALGLPSPPRLVHTTWSNITSDLAAGRFDIAMGGVSVTLTRARTAFFGTAVQRVGKTAAIRCADAAKFTDLASIDQPGVRVAVNPGGTNEAFDRANLKQATIVMVADNNAVYQAVLDGDADTMISDLIEVELQVRMHPGELCIVNPDAPFNFEELGYAIPQDPVWKHFVDAWVHVLQGSGAWNSTLQTWLDYEWPKV